MASIYDIQQEMKTLFEYYGYTVYDLTNIDSKKISQLDGEYPVVCIGRGLEVIDNDGSPTDFLDTEAEVYLNIVLECTKESIEYVASQELRKIKDIIYTNRTNSSWCNWVLNENFIAQLPSVSDYSNTYGGLDINTTVTYREKQIEGVL